MEGGGIGGGRVVEEGNKGGMERGEKEGAL